MKKAKIEIEFVIKIVLWLVVAFILGAGIYFLFDKLGI